MDKLLSLQQAADILGVHPETLRRWDNGGKLKAVIVSERGDRKYRYEDLLKVKAGHESVKYKDFDIIPYSVGFEHAPGTLIRIASFIVYKQDLVAVFAFTDGGMLLRMSHPHLKDENLLREATEIIQGKIDANKIKNHEEYTFEYYPLNFIEVNDPKWWIKTLK